MSPRVSQADELLVKFNWDVEHCRHVSKLAVSLFDQLKSLHQLTGKERDILAAAALLHDIGWTVSYQKHHKHSARLIHENAGRLPGFDAAEIELIGNVARYHRKADPALKHKPFADLPDDQREVVRRLAALLRIADGLDRPHWQAVREVQCEITSQQVRIGFRAVAEAGDHIAGATRKCSLFLKAFGLPVDFFVMS